MANRYTNLTPSAYSPLTLEEIAMVPAMKRKQHDTLLAQQEAIKTGLAKVDPYKKHFDEAIRLKQGIEGKMDTMATQLAEQGINQDMIGKTLAMNREYQDLVSPTGRIGQINAEKINIAKINEEYDKMAAANKWSPAESEYWKSKAIEEYNAKPIYDEATGRLLTYTGPTAAPTRVDYAKKMDDYASKAGMSTTEFARAAQQLATDEATGQAAVMGHSYSQKYGKNWTQLKNAYNTMKREMADPTSDVYKSMQYERRNPEDLLATMAEQTAIYRKDQSAQEIGDTINPFGDGSGGKKKDGETVPEGIFDPDSTTTLENAVKELDVTGIGKVLDAGTITPEMRAMGVNSLEYRQAMAKQSKIRSYKDVLDPSLHAQFEKAGEILKAQGKLPKGLNLMKISESQAGIIGDYMRNNAKSFTIGNDVIRPDINASEDIFMGQMVKKDAGQRNSLMLKDLDNFDRDIINPDTGVPFTKDEWKEFRKEGGKVSYTGYDSPINYRGYNFGNKLDQQVMAHKVTLYDKDNQPIGEAAVSRTPQEINTPQFKASYNITHSYRNAINKPNTWVNAIDSKSGKDVKSIKGMQVKYNNDGTMSLKKGNSVMENITPQQFMSIMYDKMLGK